nr:hypothetical protein Iba_chr13aCG7320 [Ipomoea batatas]
MLNYQRGFLSITSMEHLLTPLLMFVMVQKLNQLRIYLKSAIQRLNTPMWMVMELFQLNQPRLIILKQWKGWEYVVGTEKY